MPTYEYECKACEHRFERFQSISAKPISTCPVCKKRRVRRLIGCGAGFLFKGSGFYITDYRSDAYRKKAESEKKPGDSKPGGTSESAAASRKDASSVQKAPPKDRAVPKQSDNK